MEITQWQKLTRLKALTLTSEVWWANAMSSLFPHIHQSRIISTECGQKSELKKFQTIQQNVFWVETVFLLLLPG